MTAQLSISSAAPLRGKQEYRLLLDQIGKAAFDEAGTAFVARCLAGEPFWQHCSDNEILELSLVAQQHGLFEQALLLFSWLNQHRANSAEGWKAHAELLTTLGKHEQAAQVTAQARRFLAAEELAAWPVAAPPAAAAPPDDEARFLEPFLQLRRDEEDMRLYMRLFRGREDVFARQWADRDQGKQGYVPVQRPLQAEDVRDHVQGRKTYGIYLLAADSTVRTGIIDVDLVASLRDRRAATRQKAAIRRESVYLYTRIMETAAKAGLTCIAEVSGGKGYHFWFPLDQPLPAMDVRLGLHTLIGTLPADLSCFALEIFPKQDRLTGKGLGNLVKLPLGIHRVSGRKSYCLGAKGHGLHEQLAWLRTQRPAPAAAMKALADRHRTARVLVHPNRASRSAPYPELAELETKCSVLAQLAAMARSGRELSVREEKVLLATIGHLERGRLLLHALFARQPEYNRPLLDFKISKIRGTPLGCKRIHQLLDQSSGGELPCAPDRGPYPHPLLHLDGYQPQPAPQEKVVDLHDALLSLKTAIVQVERFL